MWLNVTRSKVITSREALREHWKMGHRGSENNDAQICSRAIAHGFDTVQIMSRGNTTSFSATLPEIVLCSGPCVSKNQRARALVYRSKVGWIGVRV